MAQEKMVITGADIPVCVDDFLQKFRHLPLGVERAWVNTDQRVVALHAGVLCTPKIVTLKREYDTLDEKETVTADLVIPEETGTVTEVLVVADQVFLEAHDLVFLDPEHVPGDNKDRMARDEVLTCLGVLEIAASGVEIPLSHR